LPAHRRTHTGYTGVTSAPCECEGPERRGQASERLAALLEGLLEPLVEERLSAGEALALLRGEGALTAARRGPRADILTP